MRKLASIWLLILWGIPAGSQNLIRNAGFEEYNRLPCHLNVYFIQDILKDWVQPIPTTTDYWNTEIDPQCFLNPNNVNVAPHKGNGMVGIITANIQGGNRIEYKEYVEIKLSNELQKGALYNVEYYARSVQLNANIDNLRSNNLGAAFTESQILYYPDDNPPDHLRLPAKVKSTTIVNDEWNKIGGCFIADSAYQYLLIGNFDRISDTELVQLTFGNTRGAAYYFIDDVKVQKMNYSVAHLSKSVTFCPDQPSVTLNALTSGATRYRWDDGTEDPLRTVSARETRDYTVTIFFKECSYTHLFTVNYLPPVRFGADTLLCYGEVLVLDASHPVKSYSWSDNSTDPVKHISTSGNYGVRVVSADCTIGDTIEVSFIDCPGFVPNVITANGDGLNEALVFENIENRTWSLEIYNRWGHPIFFSERYRNDWHARGVSNGIYYYRLQSATKVVKGWFEVTGPSR